MPDTSAPIVITPEIAEGFAMLRSQLPGNSIAEFLGRTTPGSVIFFCNPENRAA